MAMIIIFNLKTALRVSLKLCIGDNFWQVRSKCLQSAVYLLVSLPAIMQHQCPLVFEYTGSYVSDVCILYTNRSMLCLQ